MTKSPQRLLAVRYASHHKIKLNRTKCQLLASLRGDTLKAIMQTKIDIAFIKQTLYARSSNVDSHHLSAQCHLLPNTRPFALL